MKELTYKQKQFADAYIQYGNATKAAKEAGYSHKTAYSQGQRLLKHVEVQAYISERMDALQTEQIASQTEVLEMLTAILRGEQKGHILIGTGRGEQKVIEIEPSNADKIRAAELLGKRYGLWTEKKEMNVTGPIFIVDDIEKG